MWRFAGVGGDVDRGGGSCHVCRVVVIVCPHSVGSVGGTCDEDGADDNSDDGRPHHGPNEIAEHSGPELADGLPPTGTFSC